jgi:hypothetical protein
MPAPNVTYRHARTSLGLLISGALRNIEHHYGDGDIAVMDATVQLFDVLADEMDGWEIEPSRARKLERLHGELEEMLSGKGSEAEEEFARQLLTKHDLLP